ncbi:MAG: membrane protein insertion efficiency factor YidD [Firmicutes bacterium]|nr:membrane protein insertion efficiency factor YidD [Bacillota bacterium]
MKAFLYIITLKWLFVSLIWFYKKAISPILPKSCIYSPTCSTYMLEALDEWGVIKGLALGTVRILRCNPLAKGGVDKVPDNPKGKAKWLY